MDPKITLGGVQYPVAPVKFGVLKTILGPFLRTNLLTEDGIDALADMLTAALNAADPAFDRARFDDIATTYEELTAARSMIAPLIGVRLGSSPSGEATAASR